MAGLPRLLPNWPRTSPGPGAPVHPPHLFWKAVAPVPSLSCRSDLRLPRYVRPVPTSCPCHSPLPFSEQEGGPWPRCPPIHRPGARCYFSSHSICRPPKTHGSFPRELAGWLTRHLQCPPHGHIPGLRHEAAQLRARQRKSEELAGGCATLWGKTDVSAPRPGRTDRTHARGRGPASRALDAV